MRSRSFWAIVCQCVVGLSVHHCPHESLSRLKFALNSQPLYTALKVISQHTQSALASLLSL